MTLVDSNVILDVVREDPIWRDWSVAQLDAEASRGQLHVNPIIYAEISPAFLDIEAVDDFLARTGFILLDPTHKALFAAGLAHQRYRARGGPRDRILPDFLIGAQAADIGQPILTRDPRRYRSDFPYVRLITP